MSENPRHSEGFADDEFEVIISSHFSKKSEALLNRLDQRMESVLNEELAHERKEILIESPTPSRFPAMRMAFSYGLIAALFFAVGTLVNQIQTANPISSSTLDSQVIDSEEQVGKNVNATETNVPSIITFENAVKIDGPSELEPEILVRKFIENDVSQAQPSLSSIPPESDESADDDLGVEAMGSATVAEIQKSINSQIERYSQIRDGYIYTITLDGLVRIPLEDAVFIAQDLEAPSYWTFDAEGNLLIVDQTTEGFVLYQLKRVEQ
jgi:hypothetical protein